jgi:hypothetical protein
MIRDVLSEASWTSIKNPAESGGSGPHVPFKYPKSQWKQATDWEPNLVPVWGKIPDKTKKLLSAIPAAAASMGWAKGITGSEKIKSAERYAAKMVGRVWASSKGQARAVYGNGKSGPFYHDLRAREAGCKKGSYFFNNSDRCGAEPKDKGKKFDIAFPGNYRGSVYRKMWDEWESMTGFDQYPKTVEKEVVDEKSGKKVKVKETIHLPEEWKTTYSSMSDQAIATAAALLQKSGYEEGKKGHSAGRAIDIMFMKGNKEVLNKAAKLSGVKVKWPSVAERDHWHVPVAIAESKEISEVIRKVIKKI